VAEYTSRFNSQRAAANSIPQVEADYTQLVRDYQVNKQNYENLLNRRESAHLSGEMDANASVVDFRVIDPPRVPSQPAAPNRSLLLSGVTLAFLLSQLRPTFNTRRELRDVTGLPVLGVVSMIWTPEQQQKRRKSMLVFASCFAGLLLMYAGVVGSVAFLPKLF
jgi:uncharacterized protein involved in exopolysaccharide biosynthesis